jgi:hypothetical protein
MNHRPIPISAKWAICYPTIAIYQRMAIHGGQASQPNKANAAQRAVAPSL